MTRSDPLKSATSAPLSKWKEFSLLCGNLTWWWWWRNVTELGCGDAWWSRLICGVGAKEMCEHQLCVSCVADGILCAWWVFLVWSPLHMVTKKGQPCPTNPRLRAIFNFPRKEWSRARMEKKTSLGSLVASNATLQKKKQTEPQAKQRDDFKCVSTPMSLPTVEVRENQYDQSVRLLQHFFREIPCTNQCATSQQHNARTRRVVMNAMGNFIIIKHNLQSPFS